MALTDRTIVSYHKKERVTVLEIPDRDSLSIRVSTKGKVVFQYRYRFQGRARRYDLGSYPALSLKNARIEVPELRRILEKGFDVKKVKDSAKLLAQQNNKEVITLSDCVEYFLENYNKIKSPRTRKNYEYSLRKHAKGLTQSVESISPEEWFEYFQTMIKTNTANTANGMIKKLKTCLNFCKRVHFISIHNLDELQTNDVGDTPNVGDRTPTIKEIKDIVTEFHRTKCYPTTINVVKLIMLTGARCGEARTMEKQDINFEDKLWTVPKNKCKTNTRIIRPISDEALKIIKWQIETFGSETDYIFPSASYKNPISPATVNKMCRAIVNRMDLEPWSVHDFRRSLSSILGQNEVFLWVTEKMLGHKLRGILEVYNTHEWIEEQRDAYRLWENLLIDKV